MNEETTFTKGILRGNDLPAGCSLKRYYPSKELASYVEYYWIIRWDLAAGQTYTPGLLPHPNVNVAIMSTESYASGVVTSTLAYPLTGSGVVLGITFLPGGFHPFYKKPIERLTNQQFALKQFFPLARIKKVAAQLDQPDATLVAEVEKLLLSKNPEQDGTIGAISDIITYVKEDTTIRQVQEVIDAFDVSERTLQYAFKNYVGIGLKWIIMRYRLQDVADAMDAGGQDWAALAQEYGFSDQAHFIRDFRKIFGVTPAQYAQQSDQLGG